MNRRGVPFLVLLLTALLSGAGAWAGHELGPDGRDKRQADHYRAATKPLAEKLEEAVGPLAGLSIYDPVTRRDVILHGGFVTQVRSLRSDIDAVRIPSQVTVQGKALRVAADQLGDGVDLLVTGTHKALDDTGANRDTDDGFDDYENGIDALRSAELALYGPRPDDAPTLGLAPSAATYVLTVDKVCLGAQQQFEDAPISTRALFAKNADAYGAAITSVIGELEQIPITGPLADQTPRLRRELAATEVIGSALQQLARADRLRDPTTARLALSRFSAGLAHSRKVAALFDQLGSTWCTQAFAVPEKATTSTT